jgi:hypothetical protein
MDFSFGRPTTGRRTSRQERQHAKRSTIGWPGLATRVDQRCPVGRQFVDGVDASDAVADNSDRPTDRWPLNSSASIDRTRIC